VGWFNYPTRGCVPLKPVVYTRAAWMVAVEVQWGEAGCDQTNPLRVTRQPSSFRMLGLVVLRQG
jgi:hypothetical protein